MLNLLQQYAALLLPTSAQPTFEIWILFHWLLLVCSLSRLQPSWTILAVGPASPTTFSLSANFAQLLPGLPTAEILPRRRELAPWFGSTKERKTKTPCPTEQRPGWSRSPEFSRGTILPPPLNEHPSIPSQPLNPALKPNSSQLNLLTTEFLVNNSP